MTFEHAIERRAPILAEGAMIERLRRAPGVVLDPHVANAALLYNGAGRAALARAWGGYLDVAAEAGISMLLLTPTWRATPERLALAGLPDARRVCADSVAFLRGLASERGAETWIGGLMGCRGDAYDWVQALDVDSARRYHAAQAEALAEAGVDVVYASTLPAGSESLGLARAIAATGVPYILGFVVRPAGTLLDGSPIADLVARIDDAVPQPPLGYAGTCVHPENFARALDAASGARPDVATRFVALQGNGSKLSPEELDGLADIDADAPEPFADAMIEVHHRFGISVLGGCCGTDDRHLAAIAERVLRPDGLSPR